MRENLFVFIGGSDEQNGDYSRVHRLARGGGTVRWSSLKTARPGDRVLIYIQRPHSALVAKAEVLAAPLKGAPGDWAYVAKIGNFELLPNRLTLGDLTRVFPRWDWLRYPRRGVTVPKPIADRLWALAHKKQPRVQILISNSGYGLKRLEKMCSSGRSFHWHAPKLTEAGDTVFFYMEEPVSAIVFIGKALSGTRPTEQKWYEAQIGEVRKVKSPIKLAELRSLFPDWEWLRHVSMFAYVSPERAKTLQGRAKRAISAENGRPTQHRQKTEEEIIRSLFAEDLASDAEGKRKRVAANVLKRNQKVLAALKQLYGGRCQLTGKKFVFTKREGGLYSEAHHLIPLGNGGADSPYNVVIVSPLIHRMLHYAHVSGLDLSRIRDDRLCIRINRKPFTITWHPKHAEFVRTAKEI